MERKGHVHRREISQGFVRSARVTHVRNFVRNLWVRNEICVGEICVILKRNVGPGQVSEHLTWILDLLLPGDLCDLCMILKTPPCALLLSLRLATLPACAIHRPPLSE